MGRNRVVALIAVILTLLSKEVSGKKRISPELVCENVKDSFESIPNVKKTILSTPLYDPQIAVCRFQNHSDTRRPSCCTANTEQQFLLAAPKGFRQLIHEHTKTALEKLHKSNVSSIRGEYQKMTHIAHKMTEYELGQLLSLTHTESHDIISSFFTTIDSHFNFNRTVPIFDPFDTMLDELFVHVIRRAEGSANGGTNELDPNYKACVKSTRRLLSPPVFSEQAEKYIASLHYYLLAASYFAESIHLAESILRDIKDVEIIEECYQDYAKLEYCQKCYGYYQLQPCREFCENVHLVCLYQVIQLEKDWGHHLRVINILAEYLIGRTDIQAAMNGLSDQMKTYTLYAISEYPRYADKLASRCGSVIFISSSPESKTHQVTWTPPEVTEHTTDMRKLHENTIITSRNVLEGVFESLVHKGCSGLPRGGGKCWDGLNERVKKKWTSLDFSDNFAPYPDAMPDLIKAMKTQIHVIRQGLIDIFTPVQQPGDKQDSQVVEGSGSGDTEFYDDSEEGDDDDAQPLKIDPVHMTTLSIVTRMKDIKTENPTNGIVKSDQPATKIAALKDSGGSASLTHATQLTVFSCTLFPLYLHLFS